MVGIVLMVVVPVFMLRMELGIPLCERGHTPWIYKFFPCTTCHPLPEIEISDKVEAVELVWPILHVGRSISVEVVVDQVAFLVAEIVLEVAREHSCKSAPFFSGTFVIHERRDLGSCCQLLIHNA